VIIANVSVLRLWRRLDVLSLRNRTAALPTNQEGCI
jgi:hypothetical protein